MNSILGSNENIISKILEFDPNILEQKSRFKALLMDLLPQDKLTKNLILLSYEEQIHLDLIGKSRIDSIEVMRLCKKLMDACGCNRSNAERIIYLWGEALTLEIDTVSNRKEIIEELPNAEYRKSETKTGAITTDSVNIETTSELETVNAKPNRGQYCGRMRFGGGIIEECIRDNERFYPIIPFDRVLRFVNNKIGMWVEFKTVKIGIYKYAYDLTLPSGPYTKKHSVVVDTGEDVLHRRGKINTIKGYECLIYEAENDQMYKVYPSKRVDEMGLKVGDCVQFTLGISGGKLFAKDIMRIT